MASNSKNLAELLNGDITVTATDIADGSVTTAKIADDAVTTVKIPDDAVTTAKIPDDAVTGAKVVADAINESHWGGHQLGGRRNFIINGAMNVWQRGTSFAYNGFGGAGFTTDRFWFYNGGAATSGTVERSTDVPSGQGFQYSLFNNTNAQMPCGTNVELYATGSAAPFVNGQTYTISFWVKGTSATSNITMQTEWRIAHANGSNTVDAVAADPTFNVTTSWERVVLTFTLNSNPHSTSRVLDFEWGLPAGAKITGMQLEVGDNATPFEHRSYGDELMLCRRYAEEIDLGGILAVYLGIYNNFFSENIYYAVEKRAAPTMSILSGAAYWAIPGRNVVSATTNSNFDASGVTSQKFSISQTRTAAGQTPTESYTYVLEPNVVVLMQSEL